MASKQRLETELKNNLASLAVSKIKIHIVIDYQVVVQKLFLLHFCKPTPLFFY